MQRQLFALACALAFAGVGCEKTPGPALSSGPLGPLSLATQSPTPVSGNVGAPQTPPQPQISEGATPVVSVRPQRGAVVTGDISLDFADTDIREIVAQVLGNILHVTYTIDPTVQGTATLHTAQPLTRSQVLPTLGVLLSQNGATIVQDGSIYRVVPSTPAATGNTLATAESAGTEVVSLRYASAVDLARVLQPFGGNTVRVVPDPSRDVLLVTGEPAARRTMTDLISAFDIDVLSGQSYALLPVTSGGAKDFAAALDAALRGEGGVALAGQVRVVPMDRLNAVLVISSQARYIDAARRIYGLVDRNLRDTLRTWQVRYLQNSHANDIAFVLQQAFTPGSVTAQPTSAGRVAQATAGQQLAGQSLGGTGGIGGATNGGNGVGGAGGLPGLNALGGGNPLAAAGQQTATPGGAAAQPLAQTNPLFGGLDANGANTGSGADTNTMRIIPDPQNNAILVYGTAREQDTIQAMLRKIDILPLQVRIDATIAEVDLNDALQYGTQFYFRSGGINAALNNISAAAGTFGNLTSLPLGTSFPGFVIGGTNAGGAPFAISALQAVTTVRVLSSPEILVLDNQPARLQVGDLVPYLQSTQQSTIGTNAPLVNSIGYQPTGVIMQVTPRVNSGGLVTLDISQEVSTAQQPTSSTQINSPTFQERNVNSRVVVQDGETIGLAGLIQDSASTGNNGIPWLKDIPILGFLAGTQNNSRSRTELLVLITPHVVHDQRDARALTEDLREQLINAAGVPYQLQKLVPSGSSDPNARVRQKLNLD